MEHAVENHRAGPHATGESNLSRPAAARWVEQGIRAAMLVFVDNGGVARAKCVPVRALERAAEAGVGMSVVLGAFTATDDFGVVPGFAAPVGDLRLVPDLDAAAALGSDGWLWAPVDQREQDGAVWGGCQRGFLRRMCERAARQGISFRCAFELEWTAGRDASEGWQPAHTGPSYGAAVGREVFELLAVIADDMERAGIAIPQMHPEHGDGKLELSLPATDPLAAADQAALARQIVRHTSERLGFTASFAPLALANGGGNGAHAHFSVWRDGRNQFAGGEGPAGLTGEGAAFLAGVLAHIPEMTAIGAPNRLSYERLQPSTWTGAYACWGHENREAALRLEASIGPSARGSANVEWKAVDTAANPYLVLGAVVAAGLAGLERGDGLPAPIAEDPHTAPDDVARASRATRLPDGIENAIAAFEASDLLRGAMGETLFGSVLATRRREAEVTGDRDLEQLIELYRDRF